MATHSEQSPGRRGGRMVFPFVAELLRPLDHPDAAILEVGCGAMQYRPFIRGHYYGLDLPDSAYLGDEKPNFLCSAEAIPTDNNRFDVIFGVGTFYWHRDPSATFRECRRVLKPGGTLLVIDYNRMVGQRLHRVDPVRNLHAWGYEDLRNRIIDAGFSSASIRRLPLPYYPSQSAVLNLPMMRGARMWVLRHVVDGWLLVRVGK